MFDKTKEKIKSSPAYVKISQTGDKVAGCILAGFLTCLNVIGPVWNFLFVKKPDYEDDSESNDEISYEVINLCFAKCSILIFLLLSGETERLDH